MPNSPEEFLKQKIGYETLAADILAVKTIREFFDSSFPF